MAERGEEQGADRRCLTTYPPVAPISFSITGTYLLGRLEALLLPPLPSRPALTIVRDETEEADDAR
jgi:hypothetical protein